MGIHHFHSIRRFLYETSITLLKCTCFQESDAIPHEGIMN